MSLVTIQDENFIKVEESQLNRWRVSNGETWAHGFNTKEQAIKFAERVGGIFVGKCEVIDGQVAYSKVTKINHD